MQKEKNLPMLNEKMNIFGINLAKDVFYKKQNGNVYIKNIGILV